MDLMNVLVTSQYQRQIGGAGGNGSGGGADWNASEGEAGYVKNRTHYMGINVIDQRSDVVTDSGTVPATYGVLPNGVFGSPGSPKIPEGKYLLFKLGDVSYKITRLPAEDRPGTYMENIVLENGVTIRYSLTMVSPSGQSDRKRLFCRVHPMLTDGLAPYVGQTFSIQLVEDILKPLDEIYIPNSIPKVQTATVGQTVVVKAVDENGKPTEWEASDFSPSTSIKPEGGMFVARPEYGVPYTQFNELCAAYESGKTIIAVYDSYGNDQIYQLTNVKRDGQGNVSSVHFIWMDMGAINKLIIKIDGEVSLDQREFEATAGK